MENSCLSFNPHFYELPRCHENPHPAMKNKVANRFPLHEKNTVPRTQSPHAFTETKWNQKPEKDRNNNLKTTEIRAAPEATQMAKIMATVDLGGWRLLAVRTAEKAGF